MMKEEKLRRVARLAALHGDDPRAWRPRHPGGPFGPFGPSPSPFGGPWGPGWHGRGRRRGRGKRGDVRAAILTLLAEADEPMHGYEMISEIAERSGGFWKPSPGSIYPTLQLLNDEGLIEDVGGKGGKRLFRLTDEGKEAAENLGAPPWEQIDVEPTEVELHQAAAALRGALMQVATVGSPAQRKKAVAMINQLRKALYGMLGEIDDPDESDDED